MVEAHILSDGSNMCMQLCNQIPEGQGAALTGPFPVCPQPQKPLWMWPVGVFLPPSFACPIVLSSGQTS